MKRSTVKRLAALLLSLSLVFALTACDNGGLSTKDASKCVQVEMDTTYKGEFSGFLDFYSNVERSDAQEQYDTKIENEADYFLSLYGMPDPYDDSETIEADELTAKRARDLYKEIYAKAEYEVMPSTKQEDGTFAVKVTVQPLDIIHLVDEAYDDAFDAFYEKFDSVDVESMTDEEYAAWYTDAFTPAYYDALLDLLEEQIPNMGYLDEKSIVIQVQQDEDGSLFISNDDLSNLDWLLIDYESDVA